MEHEGGRQRGRREQRVEQRAVRADAVNDRRAAERRRERQLRLEGVELRIPWAIVEARAVEADLADERGRRRDEGRFEARRPTVRGAAHPPRVHAERVRAAAAARADARPLLFARRDDASRRGRLRAIADDVAVRVEDGRVDRRRRSRIRRRRRAGVHRGRRRALLALVAPLGLKLAEVVVVGGAPPATRRVTAAAAARPKAPVAKAAVPKPPSQSRRTLPYTSAAGGCAFSVE